MSEQTATERLRELLDERGVEWSTNETLTDCWTRWVAGKYRCTATEINGTFAFTVGNSTPEQAIAATLGAGTCHNEDMGKYFVCSECGAHVQLHDIGRSYVDESGKRWYGTSYEHGLKYCPNCGRKVVADVLRTE